MKLGPFTFSIQDGSRYVLLSLDNADVVVEYDYEPGEDSQTSGPPENCYEGYDESIILLNVLVNDSWVEADLFAEKQLDRWTSDIQTHHAQQRESDLEDMAAARAAEREYA